MLKHLASVIKTRIRREDVLARYGGEEFAIVLPEIDHYNAMQFAEKIRKLVEKRRSSSRTRHPGDHLHRRRLGQEQVHAAMAFIQGGPDAKLYEAKRAGGTRSSPEQVRAAGFLNG